MAGTRAMCHRETHFTKLKSSFSLRHFALLSLMVCE